MKNPNDNFFKGRIRSLTFAIRGAWLLITTEHSIMVQVGIAIIMTIVGFIMELSSIEWMFHSYKNQRYEH